MTAPNLFLSVMVRDPTQEEDYRQYRLCDYTLPIGTVFQVAYCLRNGTIIGHHFPQL